MEKYGFVYIWFDRKYKRFYIGCHWGHEKDGYICSSVWMKNSYKRRPSDFRRKILSSHIPSRLLMAEEEYRWLSMIKPNELKTKYYNIHNHHFGHWSYDTGLRGTVRERIKQGQTTEGKDRIRRSKLGDANPMKRPEIAEKAGKSKKGMIAWNKGLDKSDPRVATNSSNHSEIMKDKYKNGYKPWNKGKSAGYSDETKAQMGASVRGRIWCFDPISKKNKVIDHEDELPEGFVLGRFIKKGYKKPSYYRINKA